MKNRKILVTGAGGFIGSHLVQALAAQGASVTAMVHYNSDNAIGNLRFLPSDLADRVDVVPADILDIEFVKTLVADRDLVFHLGALIAIPHSYRAARSYVETNVVGTYNVAEAVRATDGAARMVHTSTSEVYGSAQYLPMDERHPLQAQSPYAATKIGADKMVESFHASFGLNCITVRPFNTFGPRQSARAVIPTVIGQVLSGTDRVMLGALSPVRDMTFVTDTVSGFIAAAEASDLTGGTYNLGTGSGSSVGDIAETILKIMGSDASIELDPQRVRPAKSEVDRLISDNRAFMEATGWAPEFSLEAGLEQTVAFFRENPGLLPADGYSR